MSPRKLASVVSPVLLPQFPSCPSSKHAQTPAPKKTATAAFCIKPLGPPPPRVPTKVLDFERKSRRIVREALEKNQRLLLPVKTQNVVATANLGCRLDLPAIALRARNVEFNPRRLAALVIRKRDPRATAMVYPSGKVVVTGAKSVNQALLVVRKVARDMAKLGFRSQARDTRFEVHNVVGTVECQHKVDLEALRTSPDHGRFCQFDPETFSGLVYRMHSPAKVTAMVFHSGRVVLVGGKSEALLKEAFAQLRPVLAQFQARGSLASS